MINNIPVGASLVRKPMSDLDFLYVDIEIEDDVFTYKLENPFNYVPDYVYIEEEIDGYKVKNIKRKK